MDNANHAVTLVLAVTEEHAPSKAGDGVAHLQSLGLFLEIREVQSMDAGFMSVFISEFNASARKGQKGINITCVGRAGDMASAVADAVAQWALGVLPVLARWRGQHSCLTADGQIETQGGEFDLLAGPIIARGWPEEDSEPTEHAKSFSKLLEDLLRKQRLAQRVHWLEMFACKSDDGSVDATCRLDNRDWNAGRRLLEDAASAWPNTDDPLRSHRQFAMLVPTNGDTEAIVVPTFWGRLFGRA